MKLREYFLCTKKTKIMTLFNNLFSSVSIFDVPSREHHNVCVCVCVCDAADTGSTAVTWTILTMSLLSFWALNVSVVLLSVQGQKALAVHQKYLNLCSEPERRSYGFRTT